jgi:hypothetical protein
MARITVIVSATGEQDRNSLTDRISENNMTFEHDANAAQMCGCCYHNVPPLTPASTISFEAFQEDVTRKATQIENFITSLVVALRKEALAHSEIHHQSPEPGWWSGKKSVSTEGGVSKWNEGMKAFSTNIGAGRVPWARFRPVAPHCR